MVHADLAAESLAEHISDGVVNRYDHKAKKNNRMTLAELAAEDVEKVEENSKWFFNIEDPIRHKDWQPDF